MSEVATVSHSPSMNLRFVERSVADKQIADGIWQYKTVRILQQMFVPHDWAKHDEFWQDVPCYPENPNGSNDRMPRTEEKS